MRHDGRVANTERQAWLAERRSAVVAAYDAEASTYDHDPYPHAPQQEWVARLLDSCPVDATVLDAPCGTGRYFPLLARSGRKVVGIDQSPGMLAEAERHGIAIELQHVGLQELTFVDRFEAVMTIDAMENVAPEDWPIILANLHRALRPQGHLYLTVEEDHEVNFADQFAALRARGLPAVPGEIIEGDVAGYHYYPHQRQVREWIAAAGFTVVDEAYHQENGWGYRHLMLRRASPTRTTPGGQP